MPLVASLPVLMLPAALVAPAPAAAPVFAPPLDRTMTYRMEQVRDEGVGGAQRYVLTRTVRFTRAGDGYIATVTQLAAQSDTTNPTGGYFEAALAGFTDRPIRFHIDATGMVTEVEDRAALWEMVCQAIAKEVAHQRPGARKIGDRILASMRATPVERQRSFLQSIVAPLLMADVAAKGVVPAHAVSRPARAPYGAGKTLNGTQRSWREVDGDLVSESRVAGDVPLPVTSGGTNAPQSAHIEISLVRHVDPATGLLRSSRETTTTTIGKKSETRSSTITLSMP